MLHLLLKKKYKFKKVMNICACKKDNYRENKLSFQCIQCSLRIRYLMIDSMLLKKFSQSLSNFWKPILIPLRSEGGLTIIHGCCRKESNVRIFAKRENWDLTIYRHNYPEAVSLRIHVFNTCTRPERRSSKRASKLLIESMYLISWWLHIRGNSNSNILHQLHYIITIFKNI